MKERLRQFIPPLRWLPRWTQLSPRPSTLHSGNYPDWPSAERDSKGYAAELILEKATRAMTAVRSGKAAYERDTVLFDEIEYSLPVLAALLYAAARSGNRLRVLDFGGSLGSSYVQNRQFLAHLGDLRWQIVEQPHVAATGRRLFEDEQLRFFDNLETAAAEGAPDIVLLSGVLQYLPEPFDLVARIKALQPAFIVVDRMLILETAATRLTVQTVPPHIYDASYPCWIFNRGAVVAAFADGYRKLFDFAAHAGTIVDLGDAQAAYGGWLFERR